MTQEIIVALIVALCAAYLLRKFFLRRKKGEGHCETGCGKCGKCG